MDEPQTPPVESPEQQQPVSTAPPPEQAPLTAAAEQQLATIDPRFFAAYTQSQQKLSAVAAALGIPKTSSAEQMVAAINERKRVIAQADADLEADPRLAAQAAQLRAREERIAQQQYGESAALAQTLIEAARGGSSLLELSEIVDQALTERAASRFAGAAPAQQEGTQPQATGARERNLIGQMPAVPAGTQGSQPKADGPTGFFQNLFGGRSG